MIAHWMLYSLAVGALIGVGALAGHHCCRALRVPTRWIWLAGMATALLLPAVALLRLLMAEPVPEAPGAVHVVAEAAGSGGAAAAPAAALAAALHHVMSMGAERMYAAAESLRGGGNYLAAAWLVATASLLLLFTGTMTRLERARRRWRSHRIAEMSVLVSGGTGPAVVGFLRPSIVVPAWLLAETSERQRLVVQHEAEHRNAGDHVVLALACVIVCALPWNVTLWWMLLRLRLAVELDCDARVLRSGAAARSYGALLLDIAAHTRAFPFGAPALADSRTHLERRIMAMTEKNRTPRRIRAAAAGLTALLLTTAACATELPTAAAIDDMDARRARVEAERAGFLVATPTSEAPLYIVDGVIVEEQAARDIPADEISSIEVIKAAAALRAYGERGSHGVVSIATRSPGSLTALRKGKEPLGVPLTVEGRAVRLRESAGGVMRVRAPTNMTASDPLYIVDGVIISGKFSMSSMAPESINRIEIVKGVAAQKLYGPRASNGVIVITTKAGGR